MNSVFLYTNPNVEIHIITDPDVRKGDNIEADVHFNDDELSTLTIRTRDGGYPDKRMLKERIQSLAALARHKFLGKVLASYEILPGRSKGEKIAFIEAQLNDLPRERWENMYPDLMESKQKAKRLYHSFWDPNSATSSNTGNHFGYMIDDPISIVLRRIHELPDSE